MKFEQRIQTLLKDLDINVSSDLFKQELDNAIAAREYGVSVKAILKMIEERVELIPLSQRFDD